ncbi:MAG: type II secretion system protein [Bacillota bacterium]|nr:type II secretion system protein [Bacillota bacterium]
MRKKKGFTLIEIIACIGILAILVIPLTNGFTMAMHSWNDESRRIETRNYAQDVLQTFKSSGEAALDSIYTEDNDASGSHIFKHNAISSTDNAIMYLYFNDENELKTTISGMVSIPAALPSNVVSSASLDGSQSDCVSKNSSNKVYGCAIEISKDSNDFLASSSFKVYRLNVQVWNLSMQDTKRRDSTSSSLTVHLGR